MKVLVLKTMVIGPSVTTVPALMGGMMGEQNREMKQQGMMVKGI